MLKSKEIADFVPAELTRVRPDVPIPGDIHLYFKSNSHVMLWQPAGTVLTREMIAKYLKRGIREIWVHRSEWETFERHLSSTVEELPPLTEALKPVLEPVLELAHDYGTSTWEDYPEPAPSGLVYNTRVSAQDLGAILTDPEKSDREKRALAAKGARSLLGELASPANLEEQDAVRRAVNHVVRELMGSPDGSAAEEGDVRPARRACQHIWKVASRAPELQHGVNVSTTAVLFVLAFGRIEWDLMEDIALAGLIHDIGMTALPYQLSQTPMQAIPAEQMKDYLRHAQATQHLLAAIAPELPERAGSLARCHHEPDSAEIPSSLTDPSQLLAMADILDSLCSGQWDGDERTVAAGIQKLEEMESSATAQGRACLFNPEILAAVLRWIRSNIPEDALALAASVVGDQLRSVQGG